MYIFGPGRSNWRNDNILFCPTAGVSPIVIVLTGQPSGQAGLTFSKAFKSQGGVVNSGASRLRMQ